MIVAGSASPLLLSSGGYNLTNSLRFRSSASAYLNRTPSSTSNQNTLTYSVWLKRGSLGIYGTFLSAYYGDNGRYNLIRFDNDDKLTIFTNAYSTSSSTNVILTTTQVFRDVSAWYHIVVAIDTTQATSSNRIKLYVNGTQITSFSATAYPNQNSNLFFNINTTANYIGRYGTNSDYFDGYLAEVNFIDGQALTPPSFGETSTSTGVWIPKKYTGTYGTNGFYLPFTDNSALTTSSNVGLGKDFSGNGNYWTTNNISITSGVTYDSMTDVPTLTSATAANYAVLNPLSYIGSNTATNGNLTANLAVSFGAYGIKGTIPVSSGMKSYFEVNVTSTNTWAAFGILDVAYAIGGSNYAFSTGSNCVLYYRVSGQKIVNGTTSSYSGNTFTNGDVIGVAIDYVNNTCEFFKNNTSQGTINLPSTSVNYVPVVLDVNNQNATYDINFGQRPFAYTPPTGFKALNTFNLPTPTIGATASTQANKYMDATLYTGTGATQSIVNAGGFQPDLIWLKRRNGVGDNGLYDSIRGISLRLVSNSTGAEASVPLDSFNSNGFSTTSNYNNSGETLVAWQWRASNATAVTNTAGSITSTVSANTSAGFSIVTYTGTGSAGTIGHGLGVAPSMTIIKRRDATQFWIVWQSSLAGATSNLYLNGTDSVQTDGNFTALPSSTVLSLDAGKSVNVSTATYVAYCFAQIAGYSAFGSYTGNGSSDGTFVYTGFRPRYIMIKPTNVSGEYWQIIDTARNPYNGTDANMLSANLSNAEASIASQTTDILSNGFKLRGTSGNTNGSGNTYIYACFAESPFKYANAR